jgi:hypothetical protein
MAARFVEDDMKAGRLARRFAWAMDLQRWKIIRGYANAPYYVFNSFDKTRNELADAVIRGSGGTFSSRSSRILFAMYAVAYSLLRLVRCGGVVSCTLEVLPPDQLQAKCGLLDEAVSGQLDKAYGYVWCFYSWGIVLHGENKSRERMRGLAK